MGRRAARQWDNMLRDAEENPLSEQLPPLALVFYRSVKSNFRFRAWGDAIFYPAMWMAFKRSKSIRVKIAKSIICKKELR